MKTTLIFTLFLLSIFKISLSYKASTNNSLKPDLTNNSNNSNLNELSNSELNNLLLYLSKRNTGFEDKSSNVFFNLSDKLSDEKNFNSEKLGNENNGDNQTKDNNDTSLNNKDDGSECLNTILPGIFSSEIECSLNLETTITFNEGKRTLTSDNHPKELQSYWSFDYKRIVDEAGGKNHAINNASFASGLDGNGNSLFFSPNNNIDSVTIPLNQGLSDGEFTYSFWFYLVAIPTNQVSDNEVVILQRGKDIISPTNPSSSIFQRYPAIYLNKKTQKLSVYYSTIKDLSSTQGEKLLSNGRIIPNQWVNITLTRSTSNKMTLYLNGLKDKEIVTEVQYLNPKLENYLTIGNNSLTFYLDELKLFNKEIDIDFIQASVSGFLSNVSYLSQYSLGCVSCSLEEANLQCTNKNKQICSSLELHLGGYHLARSIGWLYKGVRLWSKEALNNSEALKSKVGLCICCDIE